MSDTNLLAAQAWVRILRHWDGSLILTEDDFHRDLKTVIRAAEVAVGMTLHIRVRRILDAAALIAGPS